MKHLCIILLFYITVCGLMGAEYKYKLPIASSAQITKEGELLQIKCSFAPTKVFTKAQNAQIDAKYARQICYKAIKQYRKIENIMSLEGLYSPQGAKYENRLVTFYFAVPLAGIRELKASSQKVMPSSLSRTKSAKEDPKEKEKTTLNRSEPKQKKSLFSDSELEKYELIGYAVRCKKDVKQYFDAEYENFNACQKSNDRETLGELQYLLKRMRDQRNNIAEKLRNDSMLLRSEVNEILQEYDERMQILSENISISGMRLRQELITELQLLKREEQKKIKPSLTAVEQKEIQRQIETYENELKQIYSFVF